MRCILLIKVERLLKPLDPRSFLIDAILAAIDFSAKLGLELIHDDTVGQLTIGPLWNRNGKPVKEKMMMHKRLLRAQRSNGTTSRWYTLDLLRIGGFVPTCGSSFPRNLASAPGRELLSTRPTALPPKLDGGLVLPSVSLVDIL